jgi:hypothetical protein
MSNQILTVDDYSADNVAMLSFEEFCERMEAIPPWIHVPYDDGVRDWEQFQVIRNQEEVSAAQRYHYARVTEDEGERDVASVLPMFPIPKKVLRCSSVDVAALLYVAGSEVTGMTHTDVLRQVHDEILSHGLQPRKGVAAAPPVLVHAQEPQEDEDEEVEIVRDEDIGAMETNVSNALREILVEVGPAAWCNYVGSKFNYANIAKQGRRVSKQDIEAKRDTLSKIDQYTREAVLVFFKEFVEGALSVLCEDVMGSLSSERQTIVTCSQHVIDTAYSQYDFSCPVMQRVGVKTIQDTVDGKAVTVRVPQDVSSTVLSRLNVALKKRKLPTKMKDVVLRKCDVFGIYALLFHRAYRGDAGSTTVAKLPRGSFYYTKPRILTDQKGQLSFENSSLVVEMAFVEMTETFETTKASSAVSYLASVFPDKFDTDCTLRIRGGKKSLHVLDFYLYLVGYNPADNVAVGKSSTYHGFGLALQRARNLRSGTMLDNEYKNSYAFLKLGENYYVKYDGGLVTMLHVIAKAIAGESKRILLCLDKGGNALTFLGILSAILPSAGKQIKVFFPSGVPDVAEGFQSGSNPLVLNGGAPEYLAADADSSCLVWLCNPTSGNDYMRWGKVKETEEVAFTTLVNAAHEVYRLTTFATNANVSCVTSSFTVIYGDCPLPYDSFWGHDGTVYPIANSVTKKGFVPIGHAPHTSQRVVYYKTVGLRGIIRMTSPIEGFDEAKIDKWQVKECLAFSQNRFRMLACYTSAEIESLQLTRAVAIAPAKGTAATTEF